MIRLKEVPAARGAQWVRAGFQVFFRRPLVLTGLFAGFLFVTMLSSVLLPFVGGALALTLMPLLTLGFMKATLSVLEGELPTAMAFVEPLQGDPRRRKSLIHLGIAYGLTMTLAFGLSHWISGDSGEAARQASGEGAGAAVGLEVLMADPGWMTGMLTIMALGALLSIPFWHAPALVYWGGQSVGQALFSSTLAVWRARGAFIVFALVWMAVIVVFGLLTSLVFGLLLGSRQLMGVAALPGGLIFSTVFYASLYFTFVDSFETELLKTMR
jgi:hypothetical protein